MKKYENFTKEQLQQFCNESKSYRELAEKIGYNPNGGSTIKAMKQMIEEYNLSWNNYLGKAWNRGNSERRIPIEDYLTNKVKITSHRLRIRLLEEGYFQPVCSMCNNTEWFGKPIPLEIHHKDGNKNNNQIENLSLVCPNCHAFTDTYKSRNRNS